MLTGDIDSLLLPIVTNIGAVEVAEGPNGGTCPMTKPLPLSVESEAGPRDLGDSKRWKAGRAD